jgi:hypothetical protein
VVFNATENGGFITTCFAEVEAQQQFSAAFSAWMLRQKEQGSLRSFHSGAVSEPRGHRNTRCMLGCDAGHVKHDDGETASLQQQIGNA